MRKLAWVISFGLVSMGAFSQSTLPVDKLKAFLQKQLPAGYDSSLTYLNAIHRGSLHYLYPLYQLLREENKFRKILTDNVYYDELCQAFAFAGDYESALEYNVKGYEPVDDASQKKILKTVEGLKEVQHVDARRYIAYLAKTNRVIMINEAHAKPVHRAFTMSLLADLYRQGFRYLAMEALNNYPNHSLTVLSPLTGYYTCEPVGGELIRTALELGYQLVSYEDTAAMRHTANQRDSVQAVNIYNVIRKDTGAKILVQAGYGHISEKVLDNYIPMALAFKKISGINPLTIDQTDMTEESNFAYGRALYQAYTQQFTLTVPSIALINNEPVNITNNDNYDLAVIHPPTVYRDGRPLWLILDGLRQGVSVRPTVKNTFFVQAYYSNEYNENELGKKVPADQTYSSNGKDNYLLYLRKGKYTIVFRDIEYKVLGTLNIEVS